MNPIPYQIKQAERETARKQMVEAEERMNRTSEETIEHYVAVIEKIAFYAAGIISISITFVGFLLDKYKFALTTEIWHLPLYGYLFIGWLFLAVSLLLSLLVRWVNATYLFWSSGTELVKRRLKYLEKDNELVEITPAFVSTVGDTREDYLQKNKDVITFDTKRQRKMIFTAKLNNTVRDVAIQTAFATFTLGILLLLFVATNAVMGILN